MSHLIWKKMTKSFTCHNKPFLMMFFFISRPNPLSSDTSPLDGLQRHFTHSIQVVVLVSTQMLNLPLMNLDMIKFVQPPI